MRKIWDIPGGIHPAENKTQSTQTPIAKISLPKEFILPLNQHIGAPAEAICKTGDKVDKGEKIAEAQGYVSAHIHAPTSGIITAIEERFIPHSSGMKAPCIVIKPDGQERWCKLKIDDNFLAIDKNDALEKIREAGITGLGGAGFPTAIKLQPKAETKTHTLIVNGTECEPYITADHMLMIEHAEDIILGACLMARLLDEPETILIGIEDNKPDSIKAMHAGLKNLLENKKIPEAEKFLNKIELVAFPTKYPSGGEKQLIQILTGKEVPNGKIPADIGIVVQNLATASSAYRAVRFGEPLIKRITTIVGEALKTQQNIEVLLGTPVSHILEKHGYQQEKNSRLILGGPMMGFAMENADIPVIKTTNCILAPSKKELPNPEPAQACIRCGMCSEACPASLLPQQLFWYSQSEDFDKLQEHNLFDCIECGACSYVCPSHIPLVQYYRASKSTIRRLDEEKLQSDRARERFEFRKARIEKAEAEKEAKRLARKKAAEEAKNRVNEKKAADKTTLEINDKANDLHQANDTTEQEKNNIDALPELERAKLERAISRAENRLERAQQQLTKGLELDEESRETKRIDTLKARLKEAELKVDQAKLKLTEFDKNTANNVDRYNTSNKEGVETHSDEQIITLKKKIETLKKRLGTAKQKRAEAKENNSPSLEALTLGVQKLEEKHQNCENELKALQVQKTEDKTKEIAVKTAEAKSETNIADDAIAKAQAKAKALANMSEEEKIQRQYESLKTRLTKAKERLAKAETENNEHIDAFKDGAAKLHKKLRDFQAEHKLP